MYGINYQHSVYSSVNMCKTRIEKYLVIGGYT